MDISQMVSKCVLLHKLGPEAERTLISLNWESWATEPTDKVRCVFYTIGRDYVYGTVYPALERSEGATINSPETWGMVG